MTDIQQIWLDIIDQAKTTQLTKFRFIHDWSEYKYYKKKRKHYKWLTKTLLRSADNIFKSYCTSTKLGNANVVKLLAYVKLLQTASFYKQELVTITDMVYEYEAYLFEGNFLWAFLGEPRAECDLRDFRDKE